MRARRVGDDGASVAAVARSLGVVWSTVIGEVHEFGEPLVAEQLCSLSGVRALDMDEHRWRSRPDRWATGFCDLETGMAAGGGAGTFRGRCQGFSGL